MNAKNLIMKSIKTLAILIAFGLFVSCKQNGEYVDLNSGKTVELEKDAKTGYMVNVETGKPVYLYINKSNGDTLYGRTAKVVNSKVVKLDGGRYEYNGDGEYTFTHGDYVKVDRDGSYKVKDGDYKLKVDEDGSYKIKDGDYKKKVDEDGNVKIKDGDKKIVIKKN
jgi:hypothetical protein